MMSKPKVRHNSIVGNHNKIDPMSKLFIITEMFLGLNRLLVFESVKPVHSLLAYVYSVFTATVYVIACMNYVLWQYFIVVVTDVISMLVIIVLSSMTWRRLHKYFVELSLFDNVLGFKEKISTDAKRNAMRLLFIGFVFLTLYALSFYFVEFISWHIFILVPMKLLHAVEYFFNGHLLSLLVTRLRLINHYLETSYPTDRVCFVNNFEEEIRGKRSPRRLKIKKIINLYYSLINAFDILNSAVKWQLLFTFIKTFVVSLGDLHFLITDISQKWNIEVILISAIITIVHFGSMFSVCEFGDKLHKEVIRLRDMIACRLYQGKLDKQERRTAQALLSLTETRNLSFSLFHMFNIDVSLPFKIVGLLATYLIIFLQFEKVNDDW